MSETKWEMPDHEVARRELQAWWEASGLTAEVSEPMAYVSDDTDDEHGKPAQHAMIAYTIRIVKGSFHAARAHRYGVEFEYRLGVGHVDWEKAAAAPSLHRLRRGWNTGEDDDEGIALTMARRPGARLNDQKALAVVAAKVAKVQKVAPSPAQVLARCADEGRALYQTFEEWAGDMGYDLDSRKAEETWRACCDQGRKVIALVGKETAEKLAEWSSRL